MPVPDGNENAKHCAVIFIEANVYEVLPNGQCTGRSVYKISRFPVAINGQDKHLAIRKLNDMLAELKQKCQAS